MLKKRSSAKELKKIEKEEEKAKYLESKKKREAEIALTTAKKKDYEEKKRLQSLLEKGNKSLTPAGISMGEGAWVRGNIADVVSFIEVIENIEFN